MVRIEDGHQVADQTIVADFGAVIGHDRGTSVDEDSLAEHEGAMLPAPTSIGIDLQRRNKRPHVIDPAVTRTGCSRLRLRWPIAHPPYGIRPWPRG